MNETLNNAETPPCFIHGVGCCRFIFLDIDGVIATPDTLEDGMWGLTPEKQDLLGMIIEKTGAKIVLSSSWRKHTLESTIEHMKEHDFRFCDEIVGITIRAYIILKKAFIYQFQEALRLNNGLTPIFIQIMARIGIERN